MLRRSVSGRYLWQPEWAAQGFKRSPVYVVRDLTHRELGAAAFDFETILAEAIRRGELNRNRICEIPDREWWVKLCKAASEKPYGRYGGHLLRDRIIHFLSQRLLIEETYANRKDEIDKEQVVEPIFVTGLPRCNGHMAAHMYYRSGYVLPLRCADTLFPSIINETDRRKTAAAYMKGFRETHPQMQTVRKFGSELFDDDIALQLQVPFSIAWGLMHGLPNHLYECIHTDQKPVWQHELKLMKIFSWYRRCGQWTDGVEREVLEIDNPVNHTVDGRKDNLKRLPWLIHSPFSILNFSLVHEQFPDMRAIWMHRALNQCVPSLISCLCLHNSMYTGRAPTEADRCEMGEVAVGLFGSGSEQAIDYCATFPYERMVHWSNRDTTRSGTRLLEKTHAVFFRHTTGDMDSFRRRQSISGKSEYHEFFKPHHDAELDQFSLHEGMINDVFRAYVFQFEQFAFEKKYGTEIQNYQPIADGVDQSSYGLKGRGEEDRVTSLEQMPTMGHLMQQPNSMRPEEYAMARLPVSRQSRMPK